MQEFWQLLGTYWSSLMTIRVLCLLMSCARSQIFFGTGRACMSWLSRFAIQKRENFAFANGATLDTGRILAKGSSRLIGSARVPRRFAERLSNVAESSTNPCFTGQKVAISQSVCSIRAFESYTRPKSASIIGRPNLEGPLHDNIITIQETIYGSRARIIDSLTARGFL